MLFCKSVTNYLMDLSFLFVSCKKCNVFQWQKLATSTKNLTGCLFPLSLKNKGVGQDLPSVHCCYLSPPLQSLTQPVVEPLSCSSRRAKPCKQRGSPFAYSLNNSKVSKLTPSKTTGEKARDSIQKKNPKLKQLYIVYLGTIRD